MYNGMVYNGITHGLLPDDGIQGMRMQAQAAQAVAPGAAARGEGRMTKERLKRANETLMRYRAGKAALDNRVVENEKWFRQRHWELIEGTGGDQTQRYQTKSAWLFNALNILHSDAMTAFPRLNVLPREQNDQEEAQRLSSILPVVLEQADFREVYDANCWRKGRSGTAVYGVFWDAGKLHGLGDISIQAVDILNLFWEPGKSDIQKSANVFHVEMIEREQLESQYPDVDKRALNGRGVQVRQYEGEDRTRGDNRVAVVDWYYRRSEGGHEVLHYCKYVGTTVLYASEDDEKLGGRGWYDHGMYPFVVDPFYPVEGSPAGFGLIDVNKSAQEQIDLMNSSIVTNVLMRALPRYFEREDGGINEQDFLDWTKPIIRVPSMNLENDLQPVSVPELPGICVSVLTGKIDELKQTSGSSDIANGTSTGGVTAYSAIAAMIETSGKNTKAFSMGSYRAAQKLGGMVIELIRQFYDMPRQFRITGEQGQQRYIEYTNQALQKQALGIELNGEQAYRLPVFDLQVSAEKETTYTRLAQNEFAKELMGMGVFNPELVNQSLMMLDMMDFDGKEELERKLRDMGTMQQLLAYYQQIALELAKRYEPETAEQIAQTIMQQAGVGGAATDGQELPQGLSEKVQNDAVTGVQKKEHVNGAKARGMVDEATMPE